MHHETFESIVSVSIFVIFVEVVTHFGNMAFVAIRSFEMCLQWLNSKSLQMEKGLRMMFLPKMIGTSLILTPCICTRMYITQARPQAHDICHASIK
jgi:hypothetical protein